MTATMTDLPDTADPQRRLLLKTLLALGVTPGAALAATAPGDPERFVAAQDFRDGSHHLGWAGTSGAGSLDTDFRGHGMAFDPRRPSRAVLFGRRPGFAAAVADLGQGRLTARFEPPPGRHFYGHGTFSADGRVLYASENDFERGRGVVGVYDARDFSRLDERPSHGIGPHELIARPDGLLLVANGGIRTHPEHGRRKLNLASMAPSLVLMDPVDGTVRERVPPPDRHMSLRHLAVGPDGGYAVAIQYQRRAAGHERPVPLLATWRPGSALRLAGDRREHGRMRDYALSVIVHTERHWIAVTSPRGHRVSVWEWDGRRLLRAHELRGASGVTLTRDRRYFIVSTTGGELHAFDANTLEHDPARTISHRRVLWDNHLYNPALAGPTGARS